MTPDSTKVTFSQVYRDFKDALSGAADALKTGSEHVYEILVRQQVINSITWILIVSGFLIFGLVFLLKGMKYAKDSKGNWDWDNDSPALPFVLVGGLSCVICLLTFCGSIDTIIMGFLNPEYGAIQEVREFIKN